MSSKPHRRFRLPATLTAFLLVFTLGACGGGGDDASSDPEGSLKDAVSAIRDWDGVTLEVSFQADAAARDAMLEDDPEGEEYLDLFLNSSLRLTSTGGDDGEAQSLAVNLDGTDVVELYTRTTGDQIAELALRVDLPTIMGHVDDPQAQSDIDETLSMAGLFGLQDAADALSAGEWIEVTGFDGLMNMLEGFAGEPTEQPDDEQIEEVRVALADRTERFIDEDVDVTYVESDDVGERVRVVAGGPALQSYLDDVTDILLSNDLLDGVDASEMDAALNEIPADTEVTLDAWIDGGELRQIAVDLAAIDDAELDGELMVIIRMENFTGSLSAPDAATTVDVMSVMGQAMGGAFMGGGELDWDDEVDWDEEFEWDEEDLDLEGDLDFDLDEDLDLDLEGELELSESEIEMMLQFMECLSEDELEGLRLVMPEVAEAAEAALADGTLEYC